MPKITFTGDPRAPGRDPADCKLFGYVFPFGEPVEVEDKTIAERLARHSHFTAEAAAGEDTAPTDRMAKARAARAAKKAAQ